MTAVKRIKPQILLQGLSQAATIDRMVKGVAQGDVWDALLQLGMRMGGSDFQRIH
jgi:DNA polymerase-3 subunit delta